MTIRSRLAKHGNGTSLPRTHTEETIQIITRHRKHITFLRFAAPYFHGAHGTVLNIDLSQIKLSASLRHQLRATIGESARTDVMNAEDRVIVTQPDTMIHHFLATPLHLGITSLHRIKIQLGIITASSHGRGSSSSESDLHCRPAYLKNVFALFQLTLSGVPPADIPHAARNHDRLVISTVTPAELLFVGLENPAQLGPTKFVAKRCSTERPFNHDLVRCGNPLRKLCVILLPRHNKARHLEIGNHEGRKTSLALSTNTRGRLITNFPAHTCCGARIRRYCCRMVVRLNLHNKIDLVGHTTIYTRAATLHHKPLIFKAFDNT